MTLVTIAYRADITSLILATAYDNVRLGAVSEGLRLLLKIIQLPDKSAHPSTLLLYEQLANLTGQQEELVRAWLQRVVVDPDDEGTVNTDNLALFSAITMGLTQEERLACSGHRTAGRACQTAALAVPMLPMPRLCSGMLPVAIKVTAVIL